MAVTEHKSFPIEDVLSVALDKLLSGNGMNGIYAILQYMTGEIIHTGQIPGAMTVCRPAILAQHPELKDADASWVTEENLQTWIDTQAATYGKYIELRPLIAGWKPS